MPELKSFYAELESPEPRKMQPTQKTESILPFYQSSGKGQEEITKPGEETTGHFIGRNIARTAEKVGIEAPLETIESIGEVAKSISPIDKIMNWIGTTKLTPEQHNELKKRVAKYNIHVPGVSEPPISSEGVKKGLQKVAGQYFEPQSDLEDYFDQSLKSASQILYGGEFTKGKLLRAGIGGLGGEAAKRETEKYLGKGVTPELAKSSIMMFTSMFNWNGAKKLASSYFNKAEGANMGKRRNYMV